MSNVGKWIDADCGWYQRVADEGPLEYWQVVGIHDNWYNYYIESLPPIEKREEKRKHPRRWAVTRFWPSGRTRLIKSFKYKKDAERYANGYLYRYLQKHGWD